MNIRIFDNDEINNAFIKKAQDLVPLTEGKFKLDEDIELMKLVLKGLILESELVDMLHGMGITNHSIIELKYYAEKFKEELNVDTVLKEIELYRMLDSI